MASGASNGAKKVKIFNDGVLEGVNVAMNQGPSTPVRTYEGADGKFIFPVKQPFKIKRIKKT